MEKNRVIKRLVGGLVIPLDNTVVIRVNPTERFLPTPLQIRNVRSRRIAERVKKNQARIYDANKARRYRNLQNSYNNNAFGYGLQGKQTRYDYTTPEGLSAIQSNFNYAKGNAIDFLANVTGTGLTSGINIISKNTSLLYNKLFRGVFRIPTNSEALGTLKQYSRNPIGGGAEAIVVDNTPTTVGKITTIPVEEMAARNLIPNTVQSRYIGYVKDKGTRLPTYILRKVKILTEETFPKYVERLDRAMERTGFKRVNDPNVQYRAYTNGTVVVDDIAPGNVGLNWLGLPRLIDFNLLTVPEWVTLGFKLKKGGKLCR